MSALPSSSPARARAAHERLQRELAQAREEGDALTLCLVDIDDFEHVNDSFGHPVGDRVLGQVALPPAAGGRKLSAGRRRVRRPPPRPRRARGRRGYAFDRGARRRRAARADRRADGERRHRDVSSAGCWARRADSPGRQRAVLGEGGRQEPGSRLRACSRRVEAAPAARRRHGSRGALPRRASLAKAVDARDVFTGSHSDVSASSLHGSHAGSASRSADRADASRCEPPRPRQARDPRGDPAQARRAQRVGASRAPASPADRPRMLESLGVEPIADGAAPSRAVGRRRLSRPAARRGDPARRAHHLRCRRVRRDDVGARLRKRFRRAKRSKSSSAAPAPSSIPRSSTPSRDWASGRARSSSLRNARSLRREVLVGGNVGQDRHDKLSASATEAR